MPFSPDAFRPDRVRAIGPAEAEPFVRDAAVFVLDVRTPGEYAQLGHIPGATLVPVEVAPSALAVVPRDGRPVLVVCEHGVRSLQASALLAGGGISDVWNLVGGMSRWTGPRTYGPGRVQGPSDWLLRQASWLPRRGRVLDVACGAGRHALLVAAAGFEVTAVDRDSDSLARLGDAASRLGLSLETRQMDLETDGTDLGEGLYEAVMGFRYLHRPLFPALARALRGGGLLLYETFTEAHAAAGRTPSSPAHLLKPGELRALVASLEILDAREGEVAGDHIASIAARKPVAAA